MLLIVYFFLCLEIACFSVSSDLKPVSFFSFNPRLGVKFLGFFLGSAIVLIVKFLVFSFLEGSLEGVKEFFFILTSSEVSFGAKLVAFSSFELVREGVNFAFSFSFVLSL